MKSLIPAILLASSLSQAADLEISEARARAVPPTANISAAFMDVHNNASTPVAIVNAESSVAQSVELHSNSLTNGKMQMRRIEQIDLPAKETTQLQPGGLHIMLIGLNQPLVEGSTIDLSIQLSDGTTEALELPVEQIMPMMKGKH